MENNQNQKLDSWDGFINESFLKAEEVKSREDSYVIIAVSMEKNLDDKTILRLKLERNEDNYNFDLNQTNTKIIKNMGLESPKSLIGKKIYFEKILVMNPKTLKNQEGLKILKIDS